MKKAVLLGLGLAMIPSLCMSATRYIRSGASGAGSGADWTNAYSNFPSTLVRGDTYYVADGNYGGYTFDDPTSGSTTITIKKATQSDHGTATGWQTNFGDGTAVFTGVLRFLTDDWVVDGSVRNSDWKSGYGFQINAGGDAVEIGVGFTLQVDNIALRYIDMIGSGSDPSINSADPNNDRQVRIACGSTCTGSSNIYIGYSYIHDSGNVFVHAFRTKTLTIENTWFARNNSTAAAHGEGIVVTEGISNFTYRYNVMEDVEGTAYIATPTGGHPGCGGSVNSNWYFYGNVFMKPPNPQRDSTGGGVLYVFDHQHQGDFVFSNNTIIGVDSGFVGLDTACGQTLVAQNNLFYNVGVSGISSAGFSSPTVSHNAYFSAPVSGTNSYTGSGNPFVNLTAGNFSLTSSAATAMPAGQSLSGSYNSDAGGNVRGADGKWDRGAYEFTSGAPTVPTPPTNLITTVQ